MIIYNLTDVPAPGKRTTLPQTLPIMGRQIAPGESIEIPDRYGQAAFAGHIQHNLIAVNNLPSWYRRKKFQLNVEPAPVPEEVPENNEVDKEGE